MMADRISTQATYVGRRMNNKGKLAYAYLLATEVEESWYAKQLYPGARIGVVFTGEVDGEGRAYGSTFVPTGEHPDLEAVAAWQATDAAAQTQAADLRLQKSINAGGPTPLTNALDVVKAAMTAQRTIADRAAFAKYVEEYIHG